MIARPDAGASGRPPIPGRIRLVAGLLVPEYLVLSFLVDMPTDGPALPLVQAVRLVVPVILGALAAGFLLSHEEPGPALPELPPLRPSPLLALQPLVFAGSAALAATVLRGPAPASIAGLTIVLAGLGASAALAVLAAFPAGWILHVFTERWRFPLIAVAAGVLVWRAAVAAESLWGVLSESTLRATAALLSLTPFEVVVEGADLIGVDRFLVQVAPECSGADGIGLVVLFQSIWMSLTRRRLRFPHALLLLPIGVVAAMAANVARLATLLLVGAAGFVPLAAGGLHSKLGWVLFIGLALASVLTAEHVRWFRRDGQVRVPPGEGSGIPPEAAAYVGPLLATLAAALLSGMLAVDGFEPAYGLRILAGGAVLLALRRALPRPELSPDVRPLLIGLAVAAVWIAAAGGDARPPPPALDALPQVMRAGWIALRVAGACLLIPLVEELTFRGFLLRWLVSPDFEHLPPRRFTWTALVVSSLAFAALHQQFVLGVFAGVAFGAARILRGRLSDAVLAHAVANAAIAVAVLGFQRWELW